MSSSGIPFWYNIPGPSPVRECALELTLNIFPKPPVANVTALVSKICISPVASSKAITPLHIPSSIFISKT